MYKVLRVCLSPRRGIIGLRVLYNKRPISPVRVEMRQRSRNPKSPNVTDEGPHR